MSEHQGHSNLSPDFATSPAVPHSTAGTEPGGANSPHSPRPADDLTGGDRSSTSNKTRLEQLKDILANNKYLAIVLLVGISIVAVAGLTEALQKVKGFVVSF